MSSASSPTLLRFVPPNWIRLATTLVLVVGLLLQIAFSLGWKMTIDEVDCLELGRSFAQTGKLRPEGKKMSGGGMIPGTVLQMAIGAPLRVWEDYRSVKLLILGLVASAVLLLRKTLTEICGSRFTLIYLALFCLSPWLLYHSTFIWEPSFVFLAGAVHLFCCWRQREHASGVHSFVLAATLLLTAQVHASTTLLFLLTVILLARKQLKLNATGVVIGLVVGVLPLLPTLIGISSGSAKSPLPRNGYFGKGLVEMSVLKGFAYWFRMGGNEIDQTFRDTIFFKSWVVENGRNLFVGKSVQLLHITSLASVLISLYASWWYLRKPRVAASDRSPEAMWLSAYVVAALIALLIGTAISPAYVQGWHVVILMHAAIVPLATWIDTGWARFSRNLRALLILFIVLRIPVDLLMVYGMPSTWSRYEDAITSPLARELPPSYWR